MAPASLVNLLVSGGFGIRVEGERIIVHPSDTLTDPLRNLIRTNKPALVRYLTRMQAPANDPAPAVQALPPLQVLPSPTAESVTTSRLWLIRHDDGALVSHSFCPRATESEVRGWYPAALAIAPEANP